MKKHLLILFAAFATLAASAQTKVEIDGIWYNLVSKVKQAEVTFKGSSYDEYSNEYSGSINLPATVTHEGKAYSVTSIGDYAFSDCYSLTAITIPEGVTSIGNSAFESCSSLTTINIPEGVTSIGHSAFYGCESLTAITIPEGVTSIGDYAFCGCSSLTAINIPENSQLTSIGSSAFSYCRSLTAITIPEGVTSIGGSAFSSCSSLTAITLPASVTSIGSGAFSGCSSLTAITIPEGVTSIGSWAFSNCSSLTAINIPEGVTSIGSGAFQNCSSLKTVINYSDLDIQKGSRDYGYVAYYADRVINIDEVIDGYAFKTIEGVHYLTGYMGDNTELTLPADYKGENYQIGGRAFYKCSSLTAITIPEGVTSIGFSAFDGCSSLTAITIPEGVTSIGSGAFWDCSSLNAVHISSIEAWCEISFHNYSSNPLYYAHNLYLDGELVTELVIPSSVTSIGEWAFYGCSSLKSITIPEGVTSIGNYAFQYCSSLTAITIPEGVTSIGHSAFYGCESLTAITIPEGVTSIGDYAFCDCSSLTAITIPEGVTSIGSWAFSGCSSLTAITIPEGVTSIGSYAFYECSSLTAIVLPKNLKGIGSQAFANCAELLDVYCYAEEVPSTKSDAFDGSYPKYATLHVPTSALESYKTTAPWSSFGTIVALGASITDITLSHSSATLYEGEALTLSISVTPSNADMNLISWSSSNPSVATVDNTGKVTAIAPGTATITATANDGSGVSAQCELTVTRTAKVEIDGIWYNLVSKAKQAEVTFKGDSYDSYNDEYSGSITLPATVTHNGVAYSVTSIGDYAFQGCTSLESITIPKGVTSIESGAFSGCSSLTAITIPESVTSIEYEAFSGCSSLTAITCEAITPPTVNDSQTFYNVNKSIPVYVPAGSVEAYKSAEGWSEFANIASMPVPITHITLSQSSATLLVEESLTLTATVAPDNATDKTLTWSSSNPSVATVDNMGKVTAIASGTATIAATANDGSGVSAQCEVTVTRTAKVEIDGIWYNLFKGKVAEVTFKGDSNDSYFGEYSGSITIPAIITHNGVEYSVTSIGDKAFFYCSSLTAITLPKGVTSIGEYTFGYCSSLTAINIPEGVTSIGDGAFEGCRSLKSITLPESVTSIGNYAFIDCSSLTSIVVEEGNTIYDSRDGCNAIIETASNVLILGCSATIIPESVTSIGNNAFRGCSSLTAITLPEVVTSIGNHAFSGCSSLTAITIPEGVTSIGEGAFSGCSSLKSITLPEGVTRIGYNAFYYCSGLTDINIPESVTSIESQAFYGCSNLTAITIPEGVTWIGYSAFYGCSSLTAITIPEGVTSIGNSAFSGCSSLAAITLPEGVTSIEYCTFYNCSKLTTITLPKGVTSIGDEAFYNCSKLTTITIPEDSKLTSIGDEAFTGCSSLNTIVLPKSVGYISSKAFAGCPELSDVYCYAETVPGTEADAFDGSYIEYATLHVPTSAINSYRSTAPWSGFGKFETTSIAVERITLSQSSATLTEGEEMTLTATVEPDGAEDKSISWSSSNPSVATVDNTGKVTAIAPGTATITATANDGSGVSASCEVTVQELILGKCATPVISYVDGKVVLTCETEGAKVITTIEKGDDETREDMEFEYIPAQTLTAYATKEKYEDSDEVTLTLCWVPCEEDHEEDNGILTIPSHPVLISTQGGTITVSGLAAGTAVAAYSTAGTLLATATATDGTATLTTNLEAGSIAIVKIGDYSIKVAIK